MSNQRKQIILNEITFWKQNKLLPEHYCDFLRTLYTEGNQEDEKKSVMQSTPLKVGKREKVNGCSSYFHF